MSAVKKSLLRLYDSLCRSKLGYGFQFYFSAYKTSLHELDIIYNIDLGICCGAFKTSPIKSIYVDTEHLPLDLIREELGLHYLTRIKSAPKSPSLQVFKKESNPQRFQGSRSSKPFQIRLNEEVGDSYLKSQKIEEVDHPAIPPWLIPDASVCKKSVVKKNASEEEIRSKFLEHNICHKNHKKLYTDGSKSENGVGCAVIHEDEAYPAKLPDCASIFTAELTAVVAALDLVYHSSESKFVIYSDSWSALEAIKKFNSFHPLIQKVQEWLFWISCRHKSVHFCWVPSHVGIHGNEVADRKAKDASISADVVFSKVPPSDLKRPIRSYILRKWQERWSSPLLANNRKYKSIRSKIDPWLSSFNTSRRVEVILTRLRIGHTYATHNFILEGSSAPECAHCDRVLSVEHILVHCSMFLNQRRRYHLDGKSMAEILGDEINVDTLVEYLHAIKFFDRI